jgi:arginase
MRLGVDDGPAALRQGGFLEAAIKLLGHTVRNYDDLKMHSLAEIPKPVPKSNMQRVHLVGAYNKELSRRVEESVYENDLTIVLGGDHSIAMGSIHGHAAASSEKLCVIYIDAHADLNTPTTSYSKNGHGMVLSLLCKETRAFISEKIDGLGPLKWLQPPISCKQLGYIGLRDVEPWERVALDFFKICNYDMQDVDDVGAKETIRQVLIRVNPQLRLPIHLSFDVDALCPEYGPSTGLPVAGGLTLREVVQMVEIIAATGQLRCVDITELNPKIGTTDDVRKTAEAAHAVILAACGHARGGICVRNERNIPRPTSVPLKKYT